MRLRNGGWFWAVLMTAACASGGGPGPVAPPPPIPMTAFAAVVTDSRTHAPIEDATLDILTTAAAPDARTNQDGYASVAVPIGTTFDYAIEADGYHGSRWAVQSIGGNLQIDVALEALAPPVPPAPAHPHPLVGCLRIESGVFMDDTGPVLPLFAHGGDFLAQYVRDRPKVRDQLDAIAAAGYQGIRYWTTLGGAYWEGWHATVGPTLTPNYWQQHQDFLAELQQRHLRAAASQGDPAQTDTSFAAQFAAIARAVDGTGCVVSFFDGSNEGWQTHRPEPEANARFVKAYRDAGGRALLTLTSPPEESTAELDAFSIAPADLFDVHGYRGGRSWDKNRHVFSLVYEGRPQKRLGIQSEPPGPGPHVSVTENKEELDDEAMANLAAIALISRQAWVRFTSAGVHLDQDFRTEPGFQSVANVWRYVPADVMAYSTLHHSGSAWRGTRVRSVDGTPGYIRVNGAMHSDGRFAYVIDGEARSWSLPVERGFTGQICNLGTVPATCESVTKRAGDVLSLSFTRGRLFTGRVQ